MIKREQPAARRGTGKEGTGLALVQLCLLPEFFLHPQTLSRRAHARVYASLYIRACVYFAWESGHFIPSVNSVYPPPLGPPPSPRGAKSRNFPRASRCWKVLTFHPFHASVFLPSDSRTSVFLALVPPGLEYLYFLRAFACPRPREERGSGRKLQRRAVMNSRPSRNASNLLSGGLLYFTLGASDEFRAWVLKDDVFFPRAKGRRITRTRRQFEAWNNKDRKKGGSKGSRDSFISLKLALGEKHFALASFPIVPSPFCLLSLSLFLAREGFSRKLFLFFISLSSDFRFAACVRTEAEGRGGYRLIDERVKRGSVAA